MRGLSQRQRILAATGGAILFLVAAVSAVEMRRGAGTGVRWQTVGRGDVEQAITATGAVKPKTYVDIGTQVSGQLRHIFVAIGDRVDEGQLLAEIDPTVYRTRVAADRARIKDLEGQLRERRAERELAAIRFQRQERLALTNVSSREAQDTARAEHLAAVARMEQVEAKLEEAHATLDGDVANLGYTRILAPIAGTVVNISATEGQTLNATQTAPTILRVADLDTMTVWAQVSEADVPRLAVGIPAYFTTLGEPGRRWNGEIRQILPTPEVENDVVLFSVLVDVPNPDKRLMSEMTSQVFFVEARAENVVVAPRGVLKPTGRKGVWTARVDAGGGIETREVKTGLVTRTQAEVIEGLAPGEKVALEPAARKMKP
jgi:macrolide-specific efflux system membrane fusion protein